MVSLYKELTKKSELNIIIEDHKKNRINALLVSGKITDKANRNHPSYLPNRNTLLTKIQTDPALDHVYETELPETPVIPLNSPFATPILYTPYSK